MLTYLRLSHSSEFQSFYGISSSHSGHNDAVTGADETKINRQTGQINKDNNERKNEGKEKNWFIY